MTTRPENARSQYLSIRIRPALRELILQDAEENEVSQGQVVRSILAQHYSRREE
jgi:hypothetical protein